MESIPYDKLEKRFNGKAVIEKRIYIYLITGCMQAVFLRERVYEGEIFKLEEHTARLSTLLREWELQFLTLKMKSMRLVKK